MALNSEVLNDAAREINVLSEVESASAEQGARWLRKLNDMMAVWYDDGFDVGYFPQDSATDDFPVSAQYLLPVKLGLAVNIAAGEGATVSTELAASFRAAYDAALRSILNAKLKGANNDHMPIGEAWRGVSYNIVSDR
jgi:hypothetical protein